MNSEHVKASEEFYKRSYSNRYNHWRKYYSVRKAIFQELNKAPAQKLIKILDIGCSTGWLMHLLALEFGDKFSLQFFGIDLSPSYISAAQQQYADCGKYHFQVMDANEMGFTNEEFDIVICSEVIEHMKNPVQVLNNIYRILAGNGVLILTTPNEGGGVLPKSLKKLRRKPGPGRLGEKDSCLTEQGYGHISIKAKSEWASFFKQAGLTTEAVEGTGGLLFGNLEFDQHRIIFAIAMLLDVILEKFPWSYCWSEGLLFKLRK
ncbi:class I SAM-dependent methyltransferase [Candidatus Margulisiibacteriota bacterium]